MGELPVTTSKCLTLLRYNSKSSGQYRKSKLCISCPRSYPILQVILLGKSATLFLPGQIPEPPSRVPFPALRFKAMEKGFKALVYCKSLTLTLTLTPACDKGKLQRGPKGKERQQLKSLKSQPTG